MLSYFDNSEILYVVRTPADDWMVKIDLSISRGTTNGTTPLKYIGNVIMAAAKSGVQSSRESLTENLTKDSKKKLHSVSEHVIRKRLPPRLPKSDKDIYVTNKTSFKAQLNKCEKLLDSGESELVIHGLGAAVNRACNLALQLKENHHGTVDLDINTSTVDIIDDFEPITDEADYEVLYSQRPDAWVAEAVQNPEGIESVRS